MNKLDYLKLSFQNRQYIHRNWCVRAMATFTDPAGSAVPTEPYTLVNEPWGLAFIDDKGERVRITDYKQGDGPLFLPTTPVTIDNTWLPNVKGVIETDFGRLLANAVLITESFGTLVPYMEGEVTITAIEKIIAPLMRSNERPKGNPIGLSNSPSTLVMEPGQIYVHHYLKLGAGIEHLATFMDLFTIAMTKKSILPPTGIKEFKAKLIAEYGTRLQDPVVLSEFEDKLKEFDAAYLKDDPSFGRFTSGKILKDSRKKIHLSMGAEGGFGTLVAVTNSLTEGDPDDPEQIVAIANGNRAGSYSRGAETVEGGVAAKKMLAAANNYVIQKGDCGSKLGITRLYDKNQLEGLKGRIIISGETQKQVELDADTSVYLGRVLMTRSPMYCKLKDENICAACAGLALARYTTGISLTLTEISAAILGARMKAMHTNALTVNEFDLETVFT